MIEQAITQLLPRILSLKEKQTLFVEYVCHSQVDIYFRFAQKHDFDGNEYKRLYLLLGTDHKENIEESLKKIAPDMDDFAGDLEATAALDACAILNQAFLFFENRSPRHLKNILEHYLNVPEIMTQETNDKQFFEEAFLALNNMIFKE